MKIAQLFIIALSLLLAAGDCLSVEEEMKNDLSGVYISTRAEEIANATMEEVSDCRSLGEASHYSRERNVGKLRVEVRKKAAVMGATHIVWTPIYDYGPDYSLLKFFMVPVAILLRDPSLALSVGVRKDLQPKVTGMRVNSQAYYCTEVSFKPRIKPRKDKNTVILIGCTEAAERILYPEESNEYFSDLPSEVKFLREDLFGSGNEIGPEDLDQYTEDLVALMIDMRGNPYDRKSMNAVRKEIRRVKRFSCN